MDQKNRVYSTCLLNVCMCTCTPTGTPQPSAPQQALTSSSLACAYGSRTLGSPTGRKKQKRITIITKYALHVSTLSTHTNTCTTRRH
jgi:hypothetical protein